MSHLDQYDVIVIGSGPGGYVAAIRAAQLGLKTACIEKNETLGGTCLNVGCIPSKALLASSEMYTKFKKKSHLHGIVSEGLSFDLTQMMKRKETIVSSFNQGIQSLFQKHHVDWIQGEGVLQGPHQVSVNGRLIEAKYIILATGSEPQNLSGFSFDEKKVLSSTGALRLSKVPEKMIVIGAGAIGVELGSVFHRLGADVSFVEFSDRICSSFDASLSKGLQKSLSSQGMKFYLSHKAIKMEGSELLIQGETQETRLPFDVILIAVGRKPYVHGLGLHNVGIELDSRGFIPVDASFRTKSTSIFAIGDLIEGPMLAHKASEEGIVVAEMIAGHHPQLDYVSIPNVVYTNPELASVGFSEEELKIRGIQYKSAQYPFKANPRARCLGEEEGFVKVLAETKSRRLLGVHIFGPMASELIHEPAHALFLRSTVDQLARTCHAHPTLSETIKEASSLLLSL